MHMVIYALVEENRCIDTERRVGHWEDGVRPTSGSGSTFIRRVRLLCVLRRGEHDGCGQGSMGRFTGRIPVDSDDGQDLLDQGWEATKEEFERNLERVKEAIDELSDEEIMRDENLSRHAFHQVGAYDGPSVFLYDQHATGIRHRGQLDRLLEESEDLWIVPADVHF